MRPNAPSCERNRDPILEVLTKELANCQSVLEIGSGTGQHAVYFAKRLPHLIWQTSDREENHSGIAEWLQWSKLSNVRAPMLLDTGNPGSVGNFHYDAIFSANTSHIMSWSAVLGMFEIVGNMLTSGGAFCLYGPFRQRGEFNGEGDRLFDTSLRERDPAMAIRDLEELDKLAELNGLKRAAMYAMPANNWTLIWRK